MSTQELKARIEALFQEQHQAIVRHTDRLFAIVMVFQWVLGVVFALWISPRTWAGSQSDVHVHVLAAVVLGGLITALPVALAVLRPGARSTRHVIAVGQTLTSALLIHLTGGRIETHFHVFGSLAFLAFYRDWRVLVTASSVVLVDHFLRGLWWPESVYGVLAAPAWRALEHAGWVVFEDVILAASITRGLQEMRALAERQARLEAVNEEIEREVRARTAEVGASEQRFRALVENSTDGVMLVGADGAIRYATDEAARMVGGTPAALLGQHWTARVDPAARDRVSAALQGVLGAAGDGLGVDFRLSDGAGGWRDIEAVVVNRLADPAVQAVVVTFRDVTERRQAEEALEKQRLFLRQVIDTDPNLIFAKDRQGRFTLVNRTLAEIYGTTVEELIGRTDADFNANAEEVAAFRRDDLAVMDTLAERVIPEEVVTDTQGRKRWLQTVKRPIVGPDGRAQQVLGVATDVTERRRTEEALRQSQKMEAVGRLAGGIAHDFNNLLTVISGFSELVLREVPAGDPRAERLRQVLAATDRAAALTGQLLAFTRRQVVQPRRLDLNATVAEMEGMLRRLIGEHIDLQVSPGREIGFLWADPGQVGQVILNLVVNARDAMPGGGRLRLETALARLPSGTEAVALSVADEGVGMDAETQARIFEPFFTTKPVGEGTGLGLATVYGIVEQGGGTISVESEPGRGARFTVRWPATARGAAGASVSPAPEREPRGSETVLLVEDEAALRGLAVEVLHRQGYAVLQASNGTEALRVAEQAAGGIDLLLTDVVMPGLSGRHLAAELTARRPGLRVLYMSGYAEGVLVHEGVVAGEAPLLEKPFTTRSLAAAVRAALDRPPALSPEDVAQRSADSIQPPPRQTSPA